MSTKVELIITGDSRDGVQAIEALQRAGAQATSLLEREFAQLGTQSSLVFENQRKAATAAYEKIKTSGLATADELARAEKAHIARIKELDDAQRGVERSAMSLSSAYGAVATAIAAVGVGQFVSEMTEAKVAIDRVEASLRTTFESRSGSEFAFVAEEADRLNLVLTSTAASYAKIAAASKGTILEGEKTRAIFTGIAEASTALGLSAYDTEGMLNALQQMISKGNVQAEELRGQLGERLPGAFSLAAKAMGVTEQQLNKMLERGEVLASDLLPKLAQALHEKYGKAATEAAGKMQGALNEASNAWDALLRKSADTLPMVGTVNVATEAVKLLTNNLDVAVAGMAAMTAGAVVTNLGAIATLMKSMAGSATMIAAGQAGLVGLVGGGAYLAAREAVSWLDKELYERFDVNFTGEAFYNEQEARNQEAQKRLDKVLGDREAKARELAAAKAKAAAEEEAGREKRLKEIQKHNDRIIEIEKRTVAARLKIEQDHLQQTTSAYEAAVKSLDSLIDARQAVREQLAARNAADAAKTAPDRDALNTYLDRQDEIRNAEQKISSSFSMTAEQKAQAYANLVEKSAEYNQAVVDGEAEIISALQAEADYQENKERLQKRINELFDDEEEKRTSAALTFAEKMLDAQAQVKAVEERVAALDLVLDRMNNKEVNIIFKATGAEQIMQAAGYKSYGEYYTLGGKTYWSDDNSLADNGTSFASADPNAPFGTYAPKIIGSFATGTPYVPRTGLALIHEGERIIPAEQNRQGNFGGQIIQFSGGLNLTLPNVTDQKTARELAREILPELRRLGERYA